MKFDLKNKRRFNLAALGGAAIASLNAAPAHATDEIQVYNASIAKLGQFTIQQHLNYIPGGLTNPPFAGGLISNHSLNGTPEFAYDVIDWWVVGLYFPFSVSNERFYSDRFQ